MASRCAGILEMKNQREWRPVHASSFEWDQDATAAVCRQLDCGSAVSTFEIGHQYLGRPVWLINMSCVQSKSELKKCLTDLLTQPNISSFSTDGVSRAKQQGFQVLEGSNFTITCSIKPHFPGGSFTLTFTTSNTAQNYTLPAVNHYTHFLFSAADHTHRGEYRCVYRIYFFGLNFSSESQPLHLTIGGNFTKNQTQKSDTDSLNILTLQE
ncbi:antigen WC1.1-like isoform X2 [Plectropomus leopardus]|uniref:antigen WC1.1-like isoform X2 n=1 Tax=Plectropomus leopardus TaxID=160734 RepID=UPI001C4BDB39|nr:antigen WC1.1-like isoform X2 [Plectropomus leopardus]